MTTQTMFARALADVDPALVSAAPDLLAALENMLAVIDEMAGRLIPEGSIGFIPRADARAAITKAKGGAA